MVARTVVEAIVTGLEELEEEHMRMSMVEESGGISAARDLVKQITERGIDTIETTGPGDVMEMEWLAWRHLCRLLEARGIVVNDDDELVLAVKRWGEELVGIRMTQSLGNVARARDEARELCPQGGVPVDE